MILIKKKQFNSNIKHWYPNNTYTKKYKNESYAIIAGNASYITKNQIEACRKIIVRIFRTQTIKPTLKSCLHYLITQTIKSKGARMGGGKGQIKAVVSKINQFDLLFKLLNISKNCARIIVNKIKYKLPIKLELITCSETNDYYRNKNKCCR